MTAIARGARQAVRVLLVEDNAGDVRLSREAIQNSGRLIDLHVATDGIEAMQFLRREPPFANAPRPDIILLDLNLPRMDGFELLAEIKHDDSLKAIPAIILTASVRESDILKTYELNGNCYLNKPNELSGLESLFKSLTGFWLAKAKLPSSGLRI
jgi:CheY-like chemotaxis protein